MCDKSYHHCLTSLSPLAQQKMIASMKWGNKPLCDSKFRNVHNMRIVYEIPHLQNRAVLAVNSGPKQQQTVRAVWYVPPCLCGNFSSSAVTCVVYTEYSRRFSSYCEVHRLSYFDVLMLLKLSIVGLCCRQKVLMELGKRWPCKLSWTCIAIASIPSDHILNHLFR